MRVVLVTLLVAAFVVAGAAGAGRAAPSCRTAERAGGNSEAVFGHFPTRTRARAFIAVAEQKGFKGLAIENDGCGDFEVEDDGVSRAQRPAFALEAAQSAIQVSFEDSAPPRPQRGFVDALFGTRGTIATAEALRFRVAGVGFRYLDVLYVRRGVWRVVEEHVPAASEAGLRSEARSAKLSVTFVRS